MDANYYEVQKYRKRIKVSIEKIPYLKKKKKHKKTREELLYDRAKEIKKEILTDKTVLSCKMVTTRTDRVFNGKYFKELVDIAHKIRKAEILNYFLFAVFTTIAAAVCAAGAFWIGSPLFYLGVLILVPLFFIMFKPRIKFRDFFQRIYLPICYYCANILDESEGLRFDITDKKRNWDKKSVNKRIITNQFSIITRNYKTVVEKMIVRNYLTTYRMKRGRIEVGKKLATIFSGYSFDMDYSEEVSSDGNAIQLAIINENTFLGTDGLYAEDASNLNLEKILFPQLGEEWKIYVRSGLNLDKKKIREIQKKVIMINNEIGRFNAYITAEGVRMMLNVQCNRNGLQEEFFQAQLKNPESLSYNGFFSIVKTLYILACMNKLTKILFGRKEPVRRDSGEIKYEKRIRKSGTGYEKSVGLDQRENGTRYLKNKDAQTALDTALKLIISIVLAALLLAGLVPLLNHYFAEGVNDRTDKIYSENIVSDTVDESDMREG